MPLVERKEHRCVLGTDCGICTRHRLIDDGAALEGWIDEAECVQTPVIVQATHRPLGLERHRHLGAVQGEVPVCGQAPVGNRCRGEAHREGDLVGVHALGGVLEELRTGMQELAPLAPRAAQPGNQGKGNVEESPVEVCGDRVADAPVARHHAGNAHLGLTEDALQHRQRRVGCVDDLPPDTVVLLDLERLEHHEVEIKEKYSFRIGRQCSREVVELRDLVAMLSVEIRGETYHRVAPPLELGNYLFGYPFRALNDHAIAGCLRETLQSEEESLRLVGMPRVPVDHHRVVVGMVRHRGAGALRRRSQSSIRSCCE